MCGIAGIVGLTGPLEPQARSKLQTMNRILAHRGPDGHDVWLAEHRKVGLAHRRLSIIDVGESNTGGQPMHSMAGLSVVFNGEIYNYLELRHELSEFWKFRSSSDTETILAAYAKWGDECVLHFRGMFAFALWDEKRHRLFCARDPFGIKPLYYTVQNGNFYFASEAKALLPFLPEIETDPNALSEYVTFQYTLGEQTMFRGIKQLMPAHCLLVGNGAVEVRRYWDIRYEPAHRMAEADLHAGMQERLSDAIRLHLRSDVPVGSYLSGGIDSSLIAILASRTEGAGHKAFHGRFLEYSGYDESGFARIAAEKAHSELFITDITAADLSRNIAKVVYHLDYPVAGPGSFPQYMVSELAARHVKVVLGGQGGDEMFGGYARYVIAYLEHCLKLALHGEYSEDEVPVPMQALMPNLGVLREYVPLMRRTWGAGLFDSLSRQYFRLVDRSSEMHEEIDWQGMNIRRETMFDRFDAVFRNPDNVSKGDTFNAMTNFEFKCLLPALLQVEDRMSMAHGLESRVPLLDRPIAEFAASIPEGVKFSGGRMKYALRSTFDADLPAAITQRRDKMGFSTPLNEWFQNELREFVQDTFASSRALHRPYLNTKAIRDGITDVRGFSRKSWGLLSLELWHQQFHDQTSKWQSYASTVGAA